MIFEKRCIGVPGWQKNGFESLSSDPEGVYEQYTFFLNVIFYFRFESIPRGSPGIPGNPSASWGNRKKREDFFRNLQESVGIQEVPEGF